MKTPRILPLLALSLLSACVVPTGPVEVTRFNRASEGVPYGNGSFGVEVAGESAADRSLSASPYVAAVARELTAAGFGTATPGAADGIAQVLVEREVLRRENRRGPVSVGVGGSTGSYGSSIGLGVGINLGGGSAALLQTSMAVRIIRRSDQLVIWEGRAVQSAKAGSPAAQPAIAASKLAEALFKDFPGVSGETIRVP